MEQILGVLPACLPLSCVSAAAFCWILLRTLVFTLGYLDALGWFLPWMVSPWMQILYTGLPAAACLILLPAGFRFCTAALCLG